MGMPPRDALRDGHHSEDVHFDLQRDLAVLKYLHEQHIVFLNAVHQCSWNAENNYISDRGWRDRGYTCTRRSTNSTTHATPRPPVSLPCCFPACTVSRIASALPAWRILI
jgi:hypothetical protein